jgi:gliding motility-associated lipoprotein GldH
MYVKIPTITKRFAVIFCSLVIATCMYSCRQIDVFEKNVPIPDYKWKAADAATGSFFITDTLATYNIYIVLRHTDAYQYNNIWLQVGWQSPGDTLFSQKLDLSLGSDATGWEGTGMSDIWEVRKQLNSTPKSFRKPGEYKFSISQLMRDNPLMYVMSAGLRIEKSPVTPAVN